MRSGWLIEPSQLESILAAVPVAARLWSLERAVQAAVVATILFAVLASGSLQSWIPTAKRLRWAALLVLVALALAWAWPRVRERFSPWPFAAAAGFLALALVSAGWSVEPRESVGHAIALGLVLVAAAALARAVAGRPEAVERVLDAVVAAAGLVALGGLLVLLLRHDRAVAPATATLPARYQGLGGGPNTATMLFAVALPPAVHLALEGRNARRALGIAAALGLAASIVASGSRGALVGAAAGLAVLGLLRGRTVRRRLGAVALVGALLATSAVLMRIPQPGGPGTPSLVVAADPNPPAVGAKPPYVWVDTVLRLQDDVGHPPPGVGSTSAPGRTLTGSSGRSEAWRGALSQAVERPLLGYGFGTESDVFVDRYVGFNSGVPENSYIGLLLQLGVVGLFAFLAIAVALLVTPLHAARLDRRRMVAAGASAGALVAGLVLGVFQSFLYAPGNNATAALWISAFLLPAAAYGAQRD
jgi:O-antigen ligase